MYQRYVKRVLDFVLSLAAAIVLAIPMGIIAVWIKCDSPGPVFFRQRRVGRGHPSAEGPRLLYHQKRRVPAQDQPGRTAADL